MKKPNKYNSTAVIDGDYILWIACNPNKVLDDKGRPLRKDGKYVYTDKRVEEAIATCDAYINDVLNVTRADSFILTLTGVKNFRLKIDPAYKANRVGMDKPLWFEPVKEHMRNFWGGIEVDGLEADDIVSIIYNNLENTFIVATDKDLLDCIPGKHFDTRRGKACFITTTESQAEFNFAKSLLTGDAIDGISNMKKGYGPKTAEKDLLASQETTPIEAARAIYEKEFGEEEGLSRFYKQYSLLKMIDSLETLPEGITFEVPEPQCFNCLETIFSAEEYQIKYKDEL
jgi:5'-3' exonuclease